MRGVWIGIVVTIFVIGAFAGITQAVKPTGVVYVDDDHKCDGNKPCFGSIQKGVEKAKPGWDIVVYGGTYWENVVIDISISITGATPSDKPIVDGMVEGPTILVVSDSVTISGLYVTNGVDGILVEANIFTLMDTDVVYNLDNGVEMVNGYGSEIGSGNAMSYNGGSGLDASMTNGLQVHDNEANGNGAYGILLVNSQDATVYGNVALGNGLDGIKFLMVDPSFITSNVVSGNGNNGISVTSSQDITVSGNTAESNSGDGIAFWEVDPSYLFGNAAVGNSQNGLGVYSSNYITVEGNTADSNSGDGIAFWEVDPSVIFGNSVTGNGGNGIDVSQSQDITVSGNTAESNSGDGIAFWEVDPSYILGNTATGNGGSGISAYQSNYIGVQGNTAESNSGDGIAFWEVDPSWISSNQASNNDGNGISVSQSQDITVSGNTAESNSGDGIAFWEVDPSFIFGNLVKGNGVNGLDVLQSIEITIKDNTVQGNAVGLKLGRSSNNQIFQNNFIDNTMSLDMFESVLILFHSGCEDEVVVGNYWSDYFGGDDGTMDGLCGERRIAGDGIGDASTSHLGADYYPVLEPNGWLAIQARMRLDANLQPKTDDKGSKGNWVSLKIYIPESSGYHARDIDKDTLTLAGNLGTIPWDPKSPWSISEGMDGYSTLHVKFSRKAWVEIVFPGDWCYATLGSFNDGQTFMAVSCVTVSDPP